VTSSTEFSPSDVEAAIRKADGLAAGGDWTGAVAVLRGATGAAPGSYAAWRALGDALRELADLDGAAAAMDRAIALRPGDADLLADRAAVEAGRGFPAAEHYRRARMVAPENLDLLLGEVVARREAGEAAAIEDLRSTVAAHPTWLKGQSALAHLLWQQGDQAGFTAEIEAALERAPGERQLWFALLSTLMRANAHAAALAVVERARPLLGRDGLLDQFEAAAASEAGQGERAEALFARMDWGQPGPRIPYLRHLLRTGRPDEAARMGEALLTQPQARNIWPYLSTAWRMTGDPRWAWLEGDERLTAAFDLDEIIEMLPELAETLRGVHRAKAAPFDQTLRGGTQTEGVLLSRSEAPIKRLRAALEGAVGRFVAALPPPVAGHPFLSQPRSNPYLAGSWSVLLKAEGFHINHVHPEGWISSAFYVDLPVIDEEGDGHAGWLTLGQPPLELALGLEPTRFVRPKPGRLALFPSMMWHGTAPFAKGERLTVAFDVLS